MSKNSKVLLYGVSIIIVLSVLIGTFVLISNSSGTNKSTLTASGALASNKTVQLQFAYLSTVHTSLCSSGFSTAYNFVYSKPNGSYLQGSCCTAMNYTHYVEQITGLENYSSVSQIPKDPYNVSVSSAKQLISYDNITLTAEQQQTYDMAVNMSKDHGPCCCQCWRWYAFEGLAKYLITTYHYTSSQIANIWNLEDGCGGA